MKRLTMLFAATFLATSAVDAAPLCSEFLNPDAMPKKYRKFGPVLSGTATDWIITRDQMETNYVPSDEAITLLAEIVSEFESRGTKLAILMPPPRPLIAGQEALETLAGDIEGYDVETVSTSFNQMIDVVAKTGAIAPNLLELATAHKDLRDTYYYKHDTHWTPQGAAASAVALAHAVSAAGLSAFSANEVKQPNLTSGETFSERGSLADMAKAVCGVEIAPVEHVVPSFPKADTGLLDDDAARPNIILAGSSFSNRYKKDAYRTTEAIAGALQANVANHSVSGGGAIGAIEGIINAGLLSASNPVDLVVWELPYTEGLSQVGMYRQLLGALRFEENKSAALAVDLDASGKTKIALPDGAPGVLALHLPNSTLQRIKVELRFADGGKQTLGLIRKKHVPVALRSDWWAVSLAGLADKKLTSISVTYDAGELGTSARLHMY